MTLTDLTDEISPFPDAGNVLFTNGTSSPLRKLRPIRGSGDSPTKLRSGSSSPVEVPVTGASSSSMEVDANPRMGPLWEIVAKKLEQLEENQNTISDPVEIANMLVAMHTNSASFPRFQQLGDDEDEAEKAPDAGETSNKCKRKRRGFTKLELVLLNLMDKVMKKQEEMHKQLIEIIDKHDKDRIAREEAWRLQELERQERDKEMRQQQSARTLALISFIENLLGKQIHIPQVEPEHQHQNAERMSSFGGEFKEECDQPEERKFQALDFGSKRWPEPEVKALIRYRTALDYKFKSLDVKHNIWEEVSNAMASAGYIRDAKKCKEKWENINKYFKKTVGRGKRPKGSKTCPYFNELDALYRTGVLNLGSPLPIEMKVDAENVEQRQ